jgi:hypothetical protein
MQRSMRDEREIDYRKTSKRKWRKRENLIKMGFSRGRGEERGKKAIRNRVHVLRGMYEKKYEGLWRDMYEGDKSTKNRLEWVRRRMRRGIMREEAE